MKTRLFIVVLIYVILGIIFYYEDKISNLNNRLKEESEKYYIDIEVVREYQDAMNIYMLQDTLCSEKFIKIMDSLYGGNLDNNKN
jgi:hypothetical protein